MRGREYRFINLFRALAAFWVLAAHCMIWGGWYGLPLPSAKIAVDLFMMISGYLMAANTRLDSLSDPSGRARFWSRRFFRLAPAYYLSLALAVVTSSYFLGGYQELQALNPARWEVGGVYDPARVSYSADNIFMHVTFLFGLHPDYAFSTFLPDWSLSLEMQFYFFFPFIALVMARFGHAGMGALLGVASLAVTYWTASFLRYPEPSLLGFKLQYFIAGILIFHALTARNWKCAAVAICLSATGTHYGREMFVAPALCVLMLATGWTEGRGTAPPWVDAIVNSRLTRFASDASYSVYLFHGFFIASAGLLLADTELQPWVRTVLVFAWVFPGSYLVAYAVHRWVEQPGIALGKWFALRQIPDRRVSTALPANQASAHPGTPPVP
jgi:peptidoglycan/LPS O-acetylase OafA/YrhL